MNVTRESLLLYAITDRSWLRGVSLTMAVEAVLENGATFLQVREKKLPKAVLLFEAKQLKALAAKYHVPFVVNDDIDVALESGADGVHVGQSDIKDKDVRALIGPDKILGVSANTVETALAAQAAGADYIGVGAVFATGTKEDAVTISPAQLKEICAAVSIPVVAIGGISAENIRSLAGTGVDGVALISALFRTPNPDLATRQMRTLAEETIGQTVKDG